MRKCIFGLWWAEEPMHICGLLFSYQFFPLLQLMGKFTGIASLLLGKICKASFLPAYNQFSWSTDEATVSTDAFFIYILSGRVKALSAADMSDCISSFCCYYLSFYGQTQMLQSQKQAKFGSFQEIRAAHKA